MCDKCDILMKKLLHIKALQQEKVFIIITISKGSFCLFLESETLFQETKKLKMQKETLNFH